MEVHTATALIQKGIGNHASQTWIDLGSGSGLFTKALAGILPQRSSVLAIDKDSGALENIPPTVNGIAVRTLQADFTRTLSLEPLDGILMANALHFVHNQDAFVKQLLIHLKKIGRILLVEYDTDLSNPWVPYPLSFRTLRSRFTHLFSAIEKIGETPSAFGRASIYGAVLLPRDLPANP